MKDRKINCQIETHIKRDKKNAKKKQKYRKEAKRESRTNITDSIKRRLGTVWHWP